MTRLGPHIAPTEATQAVAHRVVSPPPSSLPSERSAESPYRCKDSGGGAALIFSSTRPFLLASLLDSSPVPASVGASRLGGLQIWVPWPSGSPRSDLLASEVVWRGGLADASRAEEALMLVGGSCAMVHEGATRPSGGTATASVCLGLPTLSCASL